MFDGLTGVCRPKFRKAIFQGLNDLILAPWEGLLSKMTKYRVQFKETIALFFSEMNKNDTL